MSGRTQSNCLQASSVAPSVDDAPAKYADAFWNDAITGWDLQHQLNIEEFFPNIFFNDFRERWMEWKSDDNTTPILLPLVTDFLQYEVTRSKLSQNTEDFLDATLMCLYSMRVLGVGLVNYVIAHKNDLEATDLETRDFRKALKTAINVLQERTSDEVMNNYLQNWDSRFWEIKNWTRVPEWAVLREKWLPEMRPDGNSSEISLGEDNADSRTSHSDGTTDRRSSIVSGEPESSSTAQT